VRFHAGTAMEGGAWLDAFLAQLAGGARTVETAVLARPQLAIRGSSVCI